MSAHQRRPARKLIFLASAALLVLGASSCASKVYNHPLLVDEKNPAVELNIIRAKQFAGYAVVFVVLLDGAEIVRLWGGRYATVRVPPGQHEFAVMGNGSYHEAGFIEMELGEPIYLQIMVGQMISPSLQKISPRRGRELMSQYQRVVHTD